MPASGPPPVFSTTGSGAACCGRSDEAALHQHPEVDWCIALHRRCFVVDARVLVNASGFGHGALVDGVASVIEGNVEIGSKTVWMWRVHGGYQPALR